MIASVRGRVADVSVDGAVLEVGGVGLLLHCTPGTLARLRVGEPASLSTALVVREDSLTLYGFVDDDERAVFEVLQTASGVGPRLAQAVLGVHNPEALRRAIATEDLAALTRVPGIGRKGAQRIVLELRDRLSAPGSASAGLPGGGSAASGGTGWQEQVAAGLTGLGYAGREAEEAVATVAPLAGDTPDVATLLRAALSVLRRA